MSELCGSVVQSDRECDKNRESYPKCNQSRQPLLPSARKGLCGDLHRCEPDDIGKQKYSEKPNYLTFDKRLAEIPRIAESTASHCFYPTGRGKLFLCSGGLLRMVDRFQIMEIIGTPHCQPFAVRCTGRSRDIRLASRPSDCNIVDGDAYQRADGLRLLHAHEAADTHERITDCKPLFRMAVPFRRHRLISR